MADVPQVLAESGALAGQRWTVTTEGLRLGREVGNEVHIDDPAVSRQHARIILHNGAVWVQDAGSRNGVFVNGERVSDHKQVKPGDRVTVGTHTFQVVLPGGATPRPPPVVTAEAPAPPKPARTGSLLPYVLGGMGLVLVFGLLLVAAVVAAFAFGAFG